MNRIPKDGFRPLLKRLDKAIKYLERGGQPKYGPDDYSVLCYVRDELSPQGLKARAERKAPEDDTNINRLQEAASDRLSHYERED